MARTGRTWDSSFRAIHPWIDEGGAGAYALAFDSLNQPFIFYSRDWNSGDLYVVKHWDGLAWTALTGGTGWEFSDYGDTPWTSRGSSSILEALPESTRWGARVERGEIRVSRAEDCRWTDLSASQLGGGVSNTASPSFSPSLAVTGEWICAAWSEWIESDWRVFVRRHD